MIIGRGFRGSELGTEVALAVHKDLCELNILEVRI